MKIRLATATILTAMGLAQTAAAQDTGGAGLNYTVFSDERTWGALQGTKLELDPSPGPAAQLGHRF